MRETHRPGTNTYTPGDEWHKCERCDFDYKMSDLQKEVETGLLVCRPCLDQPDENPKRRRRV